MVISDDELFTLLNERFDIYDLIEALDITGNDLLVYILQDFNTELRNLLEN